MQRLKELVLLVESARKERETGKAEGAMELKDRARAVRAGAGSAGGEG